jgi:hypothetical protein
MLMPHRYEIEHRSVGSRAAVEVLLFGVDPETGEEQLAFDQYCWLDSPDEADEVYADALSCGEMWRAAV